MPDLTLSIPHQLTRAQAKQHIRDQIGLLRQQQGHLLADVSDTWSGDRLDVSVRAAGQTIAGFLVVNDHNVFVSVALPWFLSMLGGTIRHRLQQDVERLLDAPDNSPESKP